MQQESTSLASGALARDWYHLGRARTLDEVGQLVDAALGARHQRVSEGESAARFAGRDARPASRWRCPLEFRKHIAGQTAWKLSPKRMTMRIR